jgi:hypothetical protein
MLKFCPRGQEDSAFFTSFYLHCLPKELRVLLIEKDFSNRRALAENGDRLWVDSSKHNRKFAGAVVGDSGYKDGSIAFAVV